MATYCFSTSAINREYEGLEIVSLTVVTRFCSTCVPLGTWAESSPNARDGATVTTGDSEVKIIYQRY